jgi:hypothetical protein
MQGDEQVRATQEPIAIAELVVRPAERVIRGPQRSVSVEPL